MHIVFLRNLIQQKLSPHIVIKDTLCVLRKTSVLYFRKKADGILEIDHHNQK